MFISDEDRYLPRLRKFLYKKTEDSLKKTKHFSTNWRKSLYIAG